MKPMKPRMLLLQAVLVLPLLAFAQNTGESQKPPQMSLTQQEQQMVECSNDFAFRLFSEARGEKSSVLSPLSVTFALGLLNNGAAGLTQQEIVNVLGFGLLSSSDSNTEATDGINMFCRKMLTEAPALDKETSVLLSNAIFLNIDEPRCLLPEFVDIATKYYDATTQMSNFNDGKTMDAINQWASDHTNGMIPQIFNEETFPTDVASYLLNAVYFKGCWTKEFNPDETREEPFGELKEMLPMMHQNGTFGYAEDGICQMLRMYYGNGAYCMTVMLPNKDKTVDDVVKTLSTKRWDNLRRMSAKEVDVKMPRFDTDTHVNLVDVMKTLGMKRAFDKDLAEIPYYCNIPQYITNMFQSARLKLDEKGTEAAAVTVIETSDKAVMPDKVREFHADRPFVYIISEQSSGTIFFIGQYTGEVGVLSRPQGIEDATRQSASVTGSPQAVDLQGRRVKSGQARKGVYIVEGRKVVVK